MYGYSDITTDDVNADDDDDVGGNGGGGVHGGKSAGEWKAKRTAGYRMAQTDTARKLLWRRADPESIACTTTVLFNLRPASAPRSVSRDR